MDMTSVAADVQLAITPLTGTTGAEIRRVNLRERLDQATVDELRRVLAG
jgi:alpha-ketoglutarate-dependent taurine dioxygenase